MTNNPFAPGGPDGPPKDRESIPAIIAGGVALTIGLATILIPLFWCLAWLLANWPTV